MKISITKRFIAHIPILEVVPIHLEHEKLPLVVYYHGWETSKEVSLTAARKMAQHNIRVILPDAMFHGERKENSRSVIPSFMFWSTIQHSLSEFDMILAHYQNEQLIDKNRIGVGGFSMGGMTTAGLLTHHPEIKVASILMGSPNYGAFIQQTMELLGQANISYPSDLPDLLSWTTSYDLAKQPEKLDGRPLFFWHGTKDQKIPYSVSRDFYDAYLETEFGQQMVFDTGLNKPHLITPDVMETSAQFFSHHL